MKIQLLTLIAVVSLSILALTFADDEADYMDFVKKYRNNTVHPERFVIQLYLKINKNLVSLNFLFNRKKVFLAKLKLRISHQMKSLKAVKVTVQKLQQPKALFKVAEIVFMLKGNILNIKIYYLITSSSV